jgi:hypothetical protein
MFRGLRTFQILSSTAAFCLALTAAPGARAETYLTVDDVPVDVTAKDANAARDQAIAAVQSKAFDKLVGQLVTNAADQARLHPGQQQIEGFVQDFMVENERVSTVRYIGTYSVRFRESLVRKYLADSGIGSVAGIGSADGQQQVTSTEQLPTGVPTAFPIAVPVVSIEEWVKLHSRLAGTPGVQRVQLDALTRNGAAITLDFLGDVIALQAALAGSGYMLAQISPADASGPGTFQLRPAGSAPPPPPQASVQ